MGLPPLIPVHFLYYAFGYPISSSPLLREMFEFVCHFEGEIPGAAPEACGNYLDQNLPMAKYLAEKYLDHVLTGITPDRLKY